MAHRRDAALLEEVLEGVKAQARTVRDAVGVEVVHVAAFHPVVPVAREGDEAICGNLAVLGLPALDVVDMHDEFGIGRDLVLEVQHEEREHQLLDVKARLGHRVAGLGPHGGKRPEALDAGMDEMGEVDDSAGLEDAEGVDDRIAGHGRVS